MLKILLIESEKKFNELKDDPDILKNLEEAKELLGSKEQMEEKSLPDLLVSL